MTSEDAPIASFAKRHPRIMRWACLFLVVAPSAFIAATISMRYSNAYETASALLVESGSLPKTGKIDGVTFAWWRGFKSHWQASGPIGHMKHDGKAFFNVIARGNEGKTKVIVRMVCRSDGRWEIVSTEPRVILNAARD